MNNRKPLGINMLILLGYMILLTLFFKWLVLMVSVIPIAMQICVNLLLSISNWRKNKSLGKTYLLSAFLVLIVGFSTCIGFTGIANNVFHK